MRQLNPSLGAMRTDYRDDEFDGLVPRVRWACTTRVFDDIHHALDLYDLENRGTHRSKQGNVHD